MAEDGTGGEEVEESDSSFQTCEDFRYRRGMLGFVFGEFVGSYMELKQK